MANQLKKKFIGNDQVGADKVLIESTKSLRAMDGATEVDLIKVSSSEVFITGFKLLESSGLIDSARLPSYVDDVLEYADLAAFPVTGETGKIYVALDSNKTYRWSGSAYVQITSGAVDSVNGQTGIVSLDAGDINMVSAPGTTVESKLVSLQGEVDATEDDISHLVTLSGVSVDSDSLGSFTGSTIPDSQTIKQAIQSLETAHEEVDQNANDLITLSGVAENATSLGSFTGTTISDSQTIKQALQALETAHEAHLNDAEGAHAATAISFDPSASGLTSTDVQGAIDELAAGATQEFADLHGVVVLASSGTPYSLPQNIHTVIVTGSTAQQINLPDEADLAQGEVFRFVNRSTANITFKRNSGSNLLPSNPTFVVTQLPDQEGTITFNTAVAGWLARFAMIHSGSGDLNANNYKIKNLANGVASSDAANYGQVSTVQSNLDAHINAVTDAHDASAISLSPAINGQTEVQGALADHESRIDSLETALAPTWARVKFDLTATDISNGYVDLAHQAIGESIHAFVDRLAIHQGEDFTISVVSGVTRITFAGDLVSPGQSQLDANDNIYVRYQYLA